jgi:hypothetical protein
LKLLEKAFIVAIKGKLSVWNRNIAIFGTICKKKHAGLGTISFSSVQARITPKHTA